MFLLMGPLLASPRDEVSWVVKTVSIIPAKHTKPPAKV